MKTNHQRGFVASNDNDFHREVASSFKGMCSKTFRNRTTNAMRRMARHDPDGVVFPSKVQHGENLWHFD